MPSEHTLAAEQGVSRVTVRRALDRLARDGLVQPAQGRGWLIVAPEARLFVPEARPPASGNGSGR